MLIRVPAGRSIGKTTLILTLGPRHQGPKATGLRVETFRQRGMTHSSNSTRAGASCTSIAYMPRHRHLSECLGWRWRCFTVRVGRCRKVQLFTYTFFRPHSRREHLTYRLTTKISRSCSGEREPRLLPSAATQPSIRSARMMNLLSRRCIAQQSRNQRNRALSLNSVPPRVSNVYKQHA